MKDVLMGLLTVLLAVALLVGGYYLGIVLALFAAALMALGVLAFIIFMVTYTVWELIQTWKK